MPDDRPECDECESLREQLADARRSRSRLNSAITALGGALGALIAELLRQKGLWH